MSETDSKRGAGVIRRMLGDGETPKAPPPLTVHRALRLALGQLADERFDIEIEVRGIEDTAIDQERLSGLRLPDAVYFLIEGPTGGVGLAIASRDFIAALIEVQTTGGISDTPGPERAPTPTDAAMIEGFLDAVLIRLGTMLSAVEGEEWTRGQRLGRAIFDLHQVPLELPDIPYRMLRAGIGFSADGKSGEIVIALPADPEGLEASDLGAQAADAARLWHLRLDAAVMASPVELAAVLHRPRLPVAAIRALKVGDVLHVPASTARAVLVEGKDRRVVATGRLGMAGGFKAIRIASIGKALPPDPNRQDDTDAAEGMFPAIDLNDLGLGDIPADSSGNDFELPSLDTPFVTPDDLPELDQPAQVTPAEGLSQDGTIPLDDLPELDGDLPPLDIKPMTIDID